MKNVLITGGAGGIGSAAAKLFSGAGYSVFINYNKNETGAKALEKAFSNIFAVKADITDEKQVHGMLLQTGEIDILVNNAGICAQNLFVDITKKEWDRMFDVNVGGIFNVTQAVLPHMIRQKKGRIINISSIWGMVGASCEVAYSASKAAVIGFTKALAKEVGPSGVSVNCIAPGVIETQMNQFLEPKAFQALIEETPLGVLGTADDIANLILFLASEGAGFITGQVISPNGGFVIT